MIITHYHLSFLVSECVRISNMFENIKNYSKEREKSTLKHLEKKFNNIYLLLRQIMLKITKITQKPHEIDTFFRNLIS